jgi:hypothetical protein
MGVALTDVFDALQAYLGSYYVNEFDRFGRTWQVNVQADRIPSRGEDREWCPIMARIALLHRKPSWPSTSRTKAERKTLSSRPMAACCARTAWPWPSSTAVPSRRPAGAGCTFEMSRPMPGRSRTNSSNAPGTIPGKWSRWMRLPPRGCSGRWKIQVGRQSDGWTCTLHPFSRQMVLEFFPSSRRAPRVFISADIRQDFKATTGNLAEQVAIILTGVRIDQLRENFGGYRVYGPAAKKELVPSQAVQA